MLANKSSPPKASAGTMVARILWLRRRIRQTSTGEHKRRSEVPWDITGREGDRR